VPLPQELPLPCPRNYPCPLQLPVPRGSWAGAVVGALRSRARSEACDLLSCPACSAAAAATLSWPSLGRASSRWWPGSWSGSSTTVLW